MRSAPGRLRAPKLQARRRFRSTSTSIRNRQRLCDEHPRRWLHQPRIVSSDKNGNWIIGRTASRQRRPIRGGYRAGQAGRISTVAERRTMTSRDRTINLSARANTLSGIARPSDAAVFRFRAMAFSWHALSRARSARTCPGRRAVGGSMGWCRNGLMAPIAPGRSKD